MEVSKTLFLVNHNTLIFPLEALQNLYGKTSTSLTRNNVASAQKGENKTKSDSSLFILKGDLRDDPSKGPADQYWKEVVSKLKSENLKLRQENIKLQVSVSEKDQAHRTELARIKEQSFKLIGEKELEFEKQLQNREEYFQSKLSELEEKLKHQNTYFEYENVNKSTSDKPKKKAKQHKVSRSRPS